MRPLAPLAALYGAAVAAREACLRHGVLSRWAIHRPVISAGNLSVGGTSKTPLVIWLAGRLGAAGRRPGIALRGYGGAYEGACERVTDPAAAGAARQWGDEACLVALRLPRAPVAVARERALAALSLVRDTGADVVILDDGFQHRRLARDLDIVLLDSRAPLGNGSLLPAGPLREPAAALRRAQVVVLSRWSESSDAQRRAAEDLVRRLHPEARLARCSLRPDGLRTLDGGALEAGRLAREGALAFCGIARPDSFHSMLEVAGVAPRGLRAFRDHHYFSTLELDALEAEAARRGARWLVTTEKDAVRLDGWRPRSARLAALRVEVEVDPEQAVLGPALASCGAGGAS